MRTFSLLAALPLIASCATIGAQPPKLADTQWRIVAIDGAAPVSAKARLSFTRDRISATVGCNGLGGSWEQRGDRLITGPFMSTQMYCDGLMEQERATSAVLGSSPHYVAGSNRMTLHGGGHELRLERELNPPQP